MKWMARTLFVGKRSLYARIAAKCPGVDVGQYLSVCSLRTWEWMDEKVFTEQVYVHAKMVIADDKVVIIGSGNFNDRSMMGTRDSEIGIVIRDVSSFEDITMNGTPYKAGSFAYSLRMHLWKIHLGIFHVQNLYYPEAHVHCSAHRDPINGEDNSHCHVHSQTHGQIKDVPTPNRECDVDPGDNEILALVIKDPITSNTYGTWCSLARENGRIYKEIFGKTIPENCKKASELKKEVLTNVTQEVMQQLRKIRGYLEDFPVDMLQDEKGFMLKLMNQRLKVNMIL